MVLELERDRGKPEWSPCIYRKNVLNQEICTNGEAKDYHKLKTPNKELVQTLRLYKPQLTEFGELHHPGTCKNCRFKLA